MAKSEKKSEKKTTEKKAPSTAVALAINERALQVDVGPAVVAAMATAEKDEGTILKLKEQVFQGRNYAIGLLVNGIVKAAEADQDNIRLEHIYSKDKAEKERLFDTVSIALGFKVMPSEEGAKPPYAEAVRKYFPPSKLTKGYKETPKYKQQRDFQVSVTNAISRGMQAALGLMEAGAKCEFDEKGKALRVFDAPKQIAGPTGSALLDGTTVEGATEKASLAAFTRIAGEAHGKTSAKKGKLSDVQNLAQKALESEDVFGEVTNAWIAAVRGMEGTYTEQQLKHIGSVYALADEVLKGQLEKAKNMKNKN